MLNLNLKLIKKHLVNDVEVSIENDPDLDYEKHSFLGKLFNIIASFFLNLMPFSWGSFLLEKTSKEAREVKQRATTYYALDMLYLNNRIDFEDGFFHGLASYFWFKLGNPMAVRNRLKLVKKILRELVFSLAKDKPEKKISIASLGCGSARAIIETTVILKDMGVSQDRLEIMLLDKDKEALNISKKLIEENKLTDYGFLFFLDKIRNFDNYKKNLDIIEMVGVLDYLSDEKAVEIFGKIYTNLKNGGYFITANISNNKEMSFITNSVNWKMVYRDAYNLISVLLAAGFHKYNIKIIFEPLKTHMVAVCEK